MFRSISQYFAGVGAALQVRSGRVWVTAEAGYAQEKVTALRGGLPPRRGADLKQNFG